MPINLLHISDLHIAKYPNTDQLTFKTLPDKLPSAVRTGAFAASYSRKKLKALTLLIYDLRKSLHGVVLTGDIATTGDKYDLGRALTFIDGRPDVGSLIISRGDPTIAGVDVPLFLLPGNHDRYGKAFNLIPYLPGSTTFHEMFSDHWSDDVRHREFEDENFVVGLFGADFSLRHVSDSNFPYINNLYSQGHAYEDVLGKLVELTNRFRDRYFYSKKKMFVIWAIHFPPQAPQLPKYMKLLNNDRVIEDANKAGVSLILSGHTHDAFALTKPEWKFTIMGAGTATQDDTSNGNHCQLLSIDMLGNGFKVTRTHFQIDGDNRFRTIKRESEAVR